MLQIRRGLQWLAVFAAFSIFFIVLFGLSPVSIDHASHKSITNIDQSVYQTKDPKAGLHLLVPATSSNPDLCKNLLSASVLNYPPAVLVNWGATEHENPYVQHLAKVEGILKHLRQIQPINSAYDLVLIVDGYDAWFQLPPEILIKRYFDTVRESEMRAKRTYGKKFSEKVIFGPDKICWPIDYSRPACWAVPQIDTLSPNAWGPRDRNSRDEHNMPRWLNSGTVIGPIAELIDLFQSTLDLIHSNYTTNSDQFYFAELFGMQEYSRLSHNPALLQAQMDESYESKGNFSSALIPELHPGQKTEYGIGIDYRSAMFQTLAFYKQYLAFMIPSHSWNDHTFLSNGYYELKFPVGLATSRLPFNDLSATDGANRSWNDVPLCYNTVTEEVPVILHFTGEKDLRRIWWRSMWFQPQARNLLATRPRPAENALSSQKIDGKLWYAKGFGTLDGVGAQSRGGARTSGSSWLSWNDLCSTHEPLIFP